METITTRICNDIVEQYKQDKNVLGVMLFGSVARGKADRFSDIDIYVLLDKKQKVSRKNFVKNGLRVDILLDTVEESKSYLKEDRNNVRRNTSHMLAHGKILFKRGGEMEKIRRTAQNNLRLKTKYTKGEILMHKYSIDDFWGEVQRDGKKKDFVAFGLDSQLLMNNILELFLKMKGEFLRQPNDMMEVLEQLDKKFTTLVEDFYKQTSMQKKMAVLSGLVEYSYKLSGGPLSQKWEIKN